VREEQVSAGARGTAPRRSDDGVLATIAALPRPLHSLTRIGVRTVFNATGAWSRKARSPALTGSAPRTPQRPGAGGRPMLAGGWISVLFGPR
jgi:hypothetical protein